MSLFARIKNAKATGQGGNYFREGTYLVRIDKLAELMTRNDDPMVAGEFTVIRHLMDPGTTSNKLGENVGWVQIFAGKNKDVAAGNVKAMIFALLGRDPKDESQDLSEEEYQKIVGKDQILAGSVCQVTAKDIRTKTALKAAQEAGKSAAEAQTFTKITWGPALTVEEAKEQGLLDDKAFEIMAKIKA